jgi:PhnB protein
MPVCIRGIISHIASLMTKKVNPIPDGFHTVTPYLSVKNAAQAIQFYQRAFDAQERCRLPTPDGKVGHAELAIGNSIIMLADEFPECGNLSPQSLNGSAVGLALYVEDVDTRFRQAVEAGATVKEELKNQFWGDRSGTVVDPFGHKWTLLTHIEDVTPDEMEARMQKMFAGAEGPSGA